MADGSFSREKFPAADAKGELNPGENKDFNIDSKSSEIATNQFIKPNEAGKKKSGEKKEKKDDDSMQTFKIAIIISALVAALAGAAFAISKKLKEK